MLIPACGFCMVCSLGMMYRATEHARLPQHWYAVLFHQQWHLLFITNGVPKGGISTGAKLLQVLIPYMCHMWHPSALCLRPCICVSNIAHCSQVCFIAAPIQKYTCLQHACLLPK